MKKLLLGIVAAGLTACASAAEDGGTHAGSVSLIDSSGQPAGTAELYQTNTGLRIVANLPGLPAGEHGFHIHAVGSCQPPDFQSAGGHYNPTSRQHGHLNPAGKHLGDMLNVNQSRAEALAVGVQMSALLDSDGAALVVHASPDDYRTDPAGNAGARIRCGVITAH